MDITGILAPAPMTDSELAAWLAFRGVKSADLDEMVTKYLGSTEDDMNDLYDKVCGRMA